jgi:PKD repeat protein
MRRSFLSIVLLASALTAVRAQDDGFNCRANDPDMLDRMEELRPGFRQHAAEAKARMDAHLADPARGGGGGTFVIPVVFHIIHANGIENISDAQIQDAMRVLNEDFNRQTPDWMNVRPEFLDRVADVGIEFRLAQLDPFGNCTNGITRTVSNATFAGDFEMTQLIQWPRDMYMNIWVCADAGGAAGYTYYPIWLDNWPEADGIVVRSDYVGSIGTSSAFRSHVLTHEVGHWLNLMHCWGDSNEPGLPTNCFEDDQVDDTPLTQGWTSCVLSGSSCGSALDNVENFMEYTYCYKMFTEGQGERMIAALTSSIADRDQLWQPQNLVATGVSGPGVLCEARFEADRREVCVGTPINFTDLSFNGVQQRLWTFTGGEPATADGAQATVVYSEPGVYPVALQVSDGSATLEAVEPAFITVLADPGASVPLVEGFEADLSEGGWSVVDPNTDGGFGITSTAAFTGSQSVRLLNTPGQAGRVDALVSSTYDMSSAEDIQISFRYAFVRRTAGNDDVLRVYVSNNCGTTWSMRKVLRATNTVSNILTTAGDQISGTFVPNGPEQWGFSLVDNVSESFHVADLRVKFEFTSGGGNALYLDDININGAPVGISQIDLDQDRSLAVVPNPATGSTMVTWRATRSGTQVVEIVDATGKVVHQNSAVSLAGVTQRMELDLSDLHAGLYLVVLRDQEGMLSTRLMVE